MLINPSTALLELAGLNTARPVIQAWQLGQTLQASVISRPSQSTAALLVDGVRLTARTALPLTQGERLVVRVESLSPSIQLKVVPQTPSTKTAGDVRTEALRIALPRQIPIAKLLTALGEAGGQSAAPKLSPNTGQAAAQVLAPIPASTALLTPVALKQAVLDSGIFLEARLAAQAAAGSGRAALGGDFKGRLLRLLGALKSEVDVRGTPTQSSRPATQPNANQTQPRAVGPGSTQVAQSAPAKPSGAETSPTRYAEVRTSVERAPLARLLNHVEGAIHRIQVNQLSSLATSEGTTSAWHTEVPVLVNERPQTVALQIERENAAGGDQEGAQWTVQLSVDLGDLGSLSARVSFSSGNVSTLIWTENAATTALVQGHLDELQQSMSAVGLKVGALQCRSGEPPAWTEPSDCTALLEVKA